ncbi:hypothetical protein I350_00210 [Cryptococcus amylolentus CBS 6273]|uniref:CUE domain-containing protein n=1 Tax=Cryptococcus amylolentus CBS 6273 TaxID=1296118 RepID=A0A1E3KEB3_9TREE|nr:hypothetical protein I350_00210 [Cryptococcus amylolentus CBS 6273]
MSQYHQYWRILTHPLAFANSAELLMGELLLYKVSTHVERYDRQQAFITKSFILVSSAVSTLLAYATIIILHPFGIRSVPGGPYGIIFSLLWQYYRIVPSLYQFNLFGIMMSQKIFTAIFALQASIRVSRLLTGYIYRTSTLFPLPSFSLRRRRLLVRSSLKDYRISQPLFDLLARYFGPLVGESAGPRNAERVLPGQVNERVPGIEDLAARANTATARGADRRSLRAMLASRLQAEQPAAPGDNSLPPTGRTATAAEEDTNGEPASTTAAMGEWVSEMTGRSGARAPTEEEIETLRGMFPNSGRDAIVRALQRNDNNTAQAVEALLEQAD